MKALIATALAAGAAGLVAYLRGRGGGEALSKKRVGIPTPMLEEALAGLLEATLSRDEPREVAVVAAASIANTLGLPDVTVIAPAAEGWEVASKHATGWQPTEPPPPGVAAWLARNAAPITIAELGDRRFGAMRAPLGEVLRRYQSTMMVPLASAGELLALILVPLDGALTPAELSFVEEVNLEASASARNARLARDAAHKIGLSREVDLAHAVERELLPAQPVRTVGKLRIAGAKVAAPISSGDFWSCHELGGGKLLLWCGTVAARGVSAALVGAVAKGACDAALATQTGTPGIAQVAQAVHEALRRRSGIPLLMLASMLLFDPDKREVVALGAGGTFPLRVTKGAAAGQGPTLSALGAGGIALGDRVDFAFKEVKSPLAPGDVFILYTPGAVNAASPSGDPFGERRLIRALRKVIAPDRIDPSALRDALLAEVAAHTGPGAQREDHVLVVVCS